MYNTWDTGSLPTPDTTGNTSWKVPDTATQIRFAFSSDGSNTPTDYIITSAPGSAESNTGMWFNSPSTADYDVTLFHNGVQGLSSSNIRWNFYNDTSSGFSYRCYGVSSGQSFANNCDHSNDLFGAIDDHCPGTNNSEVYIGSRKNIVGSGAGGSYCDTPDPNARWWVWWRDN